MYLDESARPEWMASLWRGAAFVALPLLVLLLVRNDLLQAGYIDPNVYAGLSFDYADIVRRYPGTYYATRLSHIFPNMMAMAALGDHAGYVVIRYLQLVAATVAIQTIARHYACEILAWFVTIFFVSGVWLLRSLLSDYVDGSAIVYSLCGLALLLPRRHEVWTHAAAGVAFALAANAHPMALSIPATYSVTWFVERAGRSTTSKCRSIAACAGGFAVGETGLMLTMALVDPNIGWSYDRINLDTISVLLSGAATAWYADLRTIFFELHVYECLVLPFYASIALIALLLAGDRNERRRAIGALCFASMTAALFLILHVVFRMGALRYYFALSYSLPAGVVALSALAGQWPLTRPRITIAALTIYLVAQYGLWSLADRLPNEHSPTIAKVALPSLALAFVGVIVLAALSGRLHRGHARRSAAIVALAALLASNAMFLREDTAQIYGDPGHHQVEWDVRDGARYFESFISKYVPPQDPIRFWYPNEPYLNSVHSTHLWLYSRLAHAGPKDAQMPAIDDGVRERIKQARYLAILGTGEEVGHALDAIEAEHIGLKIVGRGDFKGRAWLGYVIVIGKLQ